MRLRTLATAGFIVVLAGLIVLIAYGLFGWRDLNQRIDTISELNRFDERVDHMTSAIDYITLVRTEPSVVRSLVADASALSKQMGQLDHRQARLAATHLDEIAQMGEFLLEAPAGQDGDVRGETMLLLSRQIRIHHAGTREALDILTRQQNAELVEALYGGVRTLLFAMITVAVLVLLTMYVINRRLLHPIRAIDSGIQSLSRGDMQARIKLDTDDEFGQLARSFNQMADRRQEYELALHASQERFRQIAENIGEVFWLTEPQNSQILYLSPAYEKIWGRPMADAYEDPGDWMEAIHPDDRPEVEQASSDRSDKHYQIEYRIVRPDGGIRWIQDRSFPVHDADGRIIRNAGVARDITERRHYQTQLNERIKELGCLYQVLELTTNNELTIEEVGSQVAEILPESFMHEQLAVARVVLGSQEEFRSRNWREPVDLINSPIKVDDQVIGKVEVGYTASVEPDESNHGSFIPEERSLLHGVAVHLARMIKHRRLTRSLARSERLKAVGELTGGMAHDFNNLLTVIIGNAELLQEELKSEEHRLAGVAEMIGNAGQRGAELTQRMLAFARQQVLEPRQVDINSLLEDMRDMLQRSLGEDIELQLETRSEELPAVVDPAQLESAILNLCLNSRDAMPEGGRLTLETDSVYLDDEYAAEFEEVQAGSYVLLAVSDTGSGIAPEVVHRVFEPFFTTKEAGTGLGLSMVYGLIKQLSGHIRVYSEPGQGTTIRMYLPAAEGTGHPEPVKETHPESVNRDETILVVEDNDLVRSYACEQLRRLGYQVIEASDGREALNIVDARDDIDLLFTDVVMPGGMNGRELADRILAIRPAMKVLYTSGYTQDAIVHHGRLDADVALLPKPYHRRQLAKRLREVLSKPASGSVSRGN